MCPPSVFLLNEKLLMSPAPESDLLLWELREGDRSLLMVPWIQLQEPWRWEMDGEMRNQRTHGGVGENYGETLGLMSVGGRRKLKP